MAKKRLYHCFHYFTRGELALWGTSTALILAFFLAYDRTQFGILAASLIGVTSLIFNAKGNPFGQLLMVCFSALYGIISFSCGYYGEMATYLGMTAPMAVFALVSWLRNPYQGNRAEVQVRRLERRDAAWMLTLTVAVTAVFYFILPGRLPDLSAQRPVCGRLCRQRPGLGRTLGAGRGRGPLLSSGPGLLFCIPGQRSLWLFELAQDAAAAGSGPLLSDLIEKFQTKVETLRIQIEYKNQTPKGTFFTGSRPKNMKAAN